MLPQPTNQLYLSAGVSWLMPCRGEQWSSLSHGGARTDGAAVLEAQAVSGSTAHDRERWR